MIWDVMETFSSQCVLTFFQDSLAACKSEEVKRLSTSQRASESERVHPGKSEIRESVSNLLCLCLCVGVNCVKGLLKPKNNQFYLYWAVATSHSALISLLAHTVLQTYGSIFQALTTSLPLSLCPCCFLSSSVTLCTGTSECSTPPPLFISPLKFQLLYRQTNVFPRAEGQTTAQGADWASLPIKSFQQRQDKKKREARRHSQEKLTSSLINCCDC